MCSEADNSHRSSISMMPQSAAFGQRDLVWQSRHRFWRLLRVRSFHLKRQPALKVRTTIRRHRAAKERPLNFVSTSSRPWHGTSRSARRMDSRDSPKALVRSQLRVRAFAIGTLLCPVRIESTAGGAGQDRELLVATPTSWPKCVVSERCAAGS
jgi:hypothetical protein